MSLWAMVPVLLASGCSDGGEPSAAGAPPETEPAQPSSGADDDSGLVVSGEGAVTIAADEVYVVMFTGFDEFGVGAALLDRDTADIERAMLELGINRDDIHYVSNTPFGGSSVRVRLPSNGLPDVAADIEGAVEDVVGRVELGGLHLVIADCSARLRPALDAAVADARRAAESVAQATGVELGGVASITETADSLDYFDVSDPCDPSAIGDGASLVGFDAALEVELTEQVTVRFATGSHGPTAVVAHGHGVVTAAADTATVVVLPNPDIMAVPALSGQQTMREELLVALADAGYQGDAVKFVKMPYTGLGAEAITVQVDPAELPDAGDDVVDAVQDVMEETGGGGVLFSSSTCLDLLRAAQGEAVADGEVRLAELAGAAGIELGGLTKVVDLTGPGILAGDDTAAPVSSLTGVRPCDIEDRVAFVDSYATSSSLARFDAKPETTVASDVILGRAAG